MSSCRSQRKFSIAIFALTEQLMIALQVLDNRRPALQLQPEDTDGLSGEFESTLNTFRQRNRG